MRTRCTNGLALNRFHPDVLAHVVEIEPALALGADPRKSVAEYLQDSLEASLIPAIDSLHSRHRLDPRVDGRQAGLRLSAHLWAIYQFVVLDMIFAASGLRSLVATPVIRTRAFTAAEQLLLRPGAIAAHSKG